MTKPTPTNLKARVKALEIENERRLDEIRLLTSVVRSQSETLQTILNLVGDRR